MTDKPESRQHVPIPEPRAPNPDPPLPHSPKPSTPGPQSANAPDPHSPTTFIQLYDTLVTSGLLARLSGSAVKVLLTLAQGAFPLGTGSERNRERNRAFFRDLVAAGIVDPTDRGRLFCCVRHHEIARRTGLGKNTVTRATAQLRALGLIERRAVPKPDGTRYNVFFLLPACHLDKFNTLGPPTRTLQPVTVRSERRSAATVGAATQSPIAEVEIASPPKGRAARSDRLPKSEGAFVAVRAATQGHEYSRWQSPTTGLPGSPSPLPDTCSQIPNAPLATTKPEQARASIPETEAGRARDTIPETGTVPPAVPVPIPGTNYRKKKSTTATAWQAAVDDTFNALALLAHFAERQGVARYRPTVHDRRKLALLRERGYSQAQILAAIDGAFDRRPADAPPIRMFSYCATIALAGRPACRCEEGAPFESDEAVSNRPVGDCHGPNGGPRNDGDAGTECDRRLASLYEAEIGPLSPLVRGELAALAAAHPDPGEWEAAFREAVRANVRRLSYVQKVLEGRSARRAAQGGRKEAHGGGNHERKRKSDALGTGAGAGEGNGYVRERGARGEEGNGYVRWYACTEEELRAIQRAAAVQPLEYREVLGVDHA